MKKIKLLTLLLLSLTLQTFAFQDMSDVEIKVIPVSENIYMLMGNGGNIGISTGEDGVFMIDDEFAPLSQKILDAIKTISDKPVKFLANTHFHGDHTGGNANFEKEGALILAQENVRKRLSEKQNNGLPVITFNEDMMIHVNGNDILATHVHNAHTDGDSMIYFPQSNVLHTGDTFFNGSFPFIDLSSGGSVAGDIEAGKAGLMLINNDTKIIPGHGALATQADYEKYVEMLKGIQSNVQQAIDSGTSKEDIIANESLTGDFYSDEAMQDAFINGPKIRQTFYESLTTDFNN
tara:strand:+ start:86943 stop:87818 length:876 start_codon:yes stop_codon:yes gene_type:complete